MLPFTRFSRYFMEVAQQGSLRRAAEALHVSASAIDRQLLLAEQELGLPLFERLPSGMRLTAAGEMLLADIRRWRKDYSRTRERFDEMQGLRRGHVSIAIINALSSGQVAQTIAQLVDSYPGLTFSIRVHDNQHIVEIVNAAEVDFGLLLTESTAHSANMQALAPCPLGIAMPLEHPLAANGQLAFGKTMGYRHIVAAAPLMIHPQIAALYTRHQLPVQQAIECNDVRMIRSLIMEGAGIAVLSHWDVAEDVRQNRLAFVPLSTRQARPFQLALCTAPYRQHSRAAQLAITEITSAFKTRTT
ncbi:LysR family transcriptional regulator [Lampropedia puyangensis]|uniref:LysR family transcriptional regulator n=1 Tax=Lampropedia puyangensis TaxID=1330072 RepID=A0A4S8EW63_9BURK|nr:LysR family transcriptional regulator [Lampropedia puyangensis]THT99032.1 LysR family transcriptional regulator [Lampropedia puyangensis]